MTTKQYANRDAMALDEQGGYYIRHVCAMTKEGLHSKSDIAAEMAYRDMIIESLASEVLKLKAERNSTGVAIDNTMRGILPDEHPMLNRLQMISVISAHRESNAQLLEQINSATMSQYVTARDMLTDIKKIASRAIEE